MVELVDTLVLGTSLRVLVRVQLGVLMISRNYKHRRFSDHVDIYMIREAQSFDKEIDLYLLPSIHIVRNVGKKLEEIRWKTWSIDFKFLIWNFGIYISYYYYK